MEACIAYHINDIEEDNIEFPEVPKIVFDGDKAYKILDRYEVHRYLPIQRIINASSSIHLAKAYNILVCENGTLLEYERFDRILTPDDLVPGIIEQIVQAVSDLRQLNLIHGDLHLANFMLHGNTVKLIDYGEASIARDFLDLEVDVHQLRLLADELTQERYRQYFHDMIMMIL